MPSRRESITQLFGWTLLMKLNYGHSVNCINHIVIVVRVWPWSHTHPTDHITDHMDMCTCSQHLERISASEDD